MKVVYLILMLFISDIYKIECLTTNVFEVNSKKTFEFNKGKKEKFSRINRFGRVDGLGSLFYIKNQSIRNLFFNQKTEVKVEGIESKLRKEFFKFKETNNQDNSSSNYNSNSNSNWSYSSSSNSNTNTNYNSNSNFNLNSNSNSNSNPNFSSNILKNSWLKVLPIKQNDDTPTKFSSNTEFYNQIRDKNDIDLTEKEGEHYKNIPSKEFFWAEMNKEIFRVYTAKDKKYKNVFVSVILSDVVAQNGLKGGIEDLGNFKEGYCFVIKYIHIGEKIMLEVCTETGVLKQDWMNILRKNIRQKGTNGSEKSSGNNNSSNNNNNGSTYNGKDDNAKSGNSKNSNSSENSNSSSYSHQLLQGEARIPVSGNMINFPGFAGPSPVKGIGPVFGPPLQGGTIIRTEHMIPPIKDAITGLPLSPFPTVPFGHPITPVHVGPVPFPGPAPVASPIGPVPALLGSPISAPIAGPIAIRPGWIPIGDWSSCSKPCGIGIQRRNLKCLRPRDCFGNDFEEKQCNIQSCKADLDNHLENLKKVAEGKWEYLGTWTLCSKPCGVGVQSIVRRCISPPCEGDFEVKKPCNLGSCGAPNSFQQQAKLFDLNSYPECLPTTMDIKVKDVSGLFYEGRIVISMEDMQIFKAQAGGPEGVPYLTLPMRNIISYRRSGQLGCVDVTRDVGEMSLCPGSDPDNFLKKISDYKIKCNNKMLESIQNDINNKLSEMQNPNRMITNLSDLNTQILMEDKANQHINEQILDTKMEEFRKQMKEVLHKEENYEKMLLNQQEQMLDFEERQMKMNQMNELTTANKVINDFQLIAETEGNLRIKKKRAEREMQGAIAELQNTISQKRLNLMNNIKALRIKHELKKRSTVREMIEEKKGIGKKFMRLAKMGNPGICFGGGISPVDGVFIASYCHGNVLDLTLQVECQNPSRFCYICCDNEIGALNKEHLDCCYSRCDRNMNIIEPGKMAIITRARPQTGPDCLAFTETYGLATLKGFAAPIIKPTPIQGVVPIGGIATPAPAPVPLVGGIYPGFAPAPIAGPFGVPVARPVGLTPGPVPLPVAPIAPVAPVGVVHGRLADPLMENMMVSIPQEY